MDARNRRPESRAAAKRSSRKFYHSAKGREAKVEAQRRYAQKDPANQMLIRARTRAKKAGIPFTITKEDIVIPPLCPVFGTEMIVATKEFRESEGGGRINSLSLDRIIPALGYVPGNIAVISWEANRIKSQWSLEKLKAVVTWLESLEKKV